MAKKVVIPASELHREAAKTIKRVALHDEHVIVERDGYPVAVMISYQEYEKIMNERAVSLHRNLTRSLAEEAARLGLTEDQLLDELEQDKRKVFEERYGKSRS